MSGCLRDVGCLPGTLQYIFFFYIFVGGTERKNISPYSDRFFFFSPY